MSAFWREIVRISDAADDWASDHNDGCLLTGLVAMAVIQVVVRWAMQ